MPVCAYLVCIQNFNKYPHCSCMCVYCSSIQLTTIYTQPPLLCTSRVLFCSLVVAQRTTGVVACHFNSSTERKKSRAPLWLLRGSLQPLFLCSYSGIAFPIVCLCACVCVFCVCGTLCGCP
jgi:hypothetical protein